MQRVLEPELLDSLPPQDPRAIHSRRDLRRINAFMGSAHFLSRSIAGFPRAPETILELGAGDGTLMLKVAQKLAPLWRKEVRLYLLDREPVVHEATLCEFADLGWKVECLKSDLADWLSEPNPPRVNLIAANLFLHHFSDEQLRCVFARVATLTHSFVSCDPRRWNPAVIATRFLGLLGCNEVTRFDARVSVRAGFRDAELSRLWPANSGFVLAEMPAGFAAHLFSASRSA